MLATLPAAASARAVSTPRAGGFHEDSSHLVLSFLPGVGKRPLNLPGSHWGSFQGEEHFHGGFRMSSAVRLKNEGKVSPEQEAEEIEYERILP